MRCSTWPVVIVLYLAMGLLQAGELPYSQGLLFRVEAGPGISNYLFGTIHSADQRVVDLPAPVEQAFSRSSRVMVEARMDTPALLSATALMRLESGILLSDLVDRPLYRRSVDAALRLGISESVLRTYKPWAVATLLSMPPSNSAHFLDLLLFNRAQAEGKELGGLESLEEQLGLFDSLGLEDQTLLLAESLNNLPDLPQLLEDMHRAYLLRDLAALVEMNEPSSPLLESPAMLRFRYELVEGRNRRMVERLRFPLSQGGVFVAIGALHLPGEEGVLNLLRKQGYLVERVY